MLWIHLDMVVQDFLSNYQPLKSPCDFTASGFKNNVIEGVLGCDVVYKVFIVMRYIGFGHLVHLVVAATLVKDQIIQS